jgi:hypothetical protein
VSILPAAQADDIRPPTRSEGIRLPSWDDAPVPPPRQWVGPRRFGYPPIRRSRLDELAQGMDVLERRLEALEDLIDRIGLPAGEP